jgi:GDPmannose 4,6-dehydratase
MAHEIMSREAEPKPRSSLICGISGQDGAYLARLLLDRGVAVTGSSRDPEAPMPNLQALGLRQRVPVLALDPTDPEAARELIARLRPDGIYNLAGQSSVGLSFDHPLETFDGIANGTLHLLEAIRRVDPAIRYFGAGSGEVFGDTGGIPASETTAFAPASPYAAAKAAAAHLVAAYRAAYGLFACTGHLFNHESPLRPARFVTRKIVSAAVRIAGGGGETLHLGNLDVQRDWGWAPEYVEAMVAMLEKPTPRDLVIATGETRPLADFVEAAFSAVGLRWREHVEFDPALARPTDIPVARADPRLAREVLGWEARTRLDGVARAMVEAERAAAGDRG